MQAGCLRLRKQVKFFASTVKNDLPNALQRTNRLRVHIAKSIYYLIIGSNDIFCKLSPKWNETKNKQVFLEYLFQNLVKHIEVVSTSYSLLGLPIIEDMHHIYILCI